MHAGQLELGRWLESFTGEALPPASLCLAWLVFLVRRQNEETFGWKQQSVYRLEQILRLNKKLRMCMQAVNLVLIQDMSCSWTGQTARILSLLFVWSTCCCLQWVCGDALGCVVS